MSVRHFITWYTVCFLLGNGYVASKSSQEWGIVPGGDKNGCDDGILAANGGSGGDGDIEGDGCYYVFSFIHTVLCVPPNIIIEIKKNVC